jgi:aminoglycoside phosphotransferase family enzyme/predicted kinase
MQTTTHRALIVATTIKEDLLRLEAYAPIRTSAIVLRETQISWVFLLDNDAFKVKKPVDLGLLDFRTKSRRQAACNAEVRLNARLAPHVYRKVVPVRVGEDGRARIGGNGAIIDWAIHMVRLSDEARADRLLARGALTPCVIDAIAQRIAGFHRSARSDAATARFGLPAMIAQNLHENFAQTRETLGRYLRPEDADEVIRWQTAFLRGHATLFERRIATGRVRDGHGDLRLEHVYLEPNDEVTIIDCIEFNERFRFADVCADLAFLSMDLAAHGRVDLAERLLAAYAREVDDFDLYAVVDFYESYRAFVRGKMAAMLAQNTAIDESTRRRADEDARRYFLLALSADRRPVLLPAVVAVGGLIGSGKSTIAECIGAEMGAPVIDADRTRKWMLGVEATRRLQEPVWSGAYDPAFTETVYAEVLRRAGVVLESGRPVVLDASFRSREMRRAARELAILHNVPFRFVECHAPADVCKARLVDRERHRSVSDGRLAIFDDFSARFEAVTELPPFEHLMIDTTRPVDFSVESLRAALDTWPKGFDG